MPLNKHFGGHGSEVMKKMRSEYGEEKGEKVFYATENKQKAKSSSSKRHKALEGLKKAGK